MQNLKIQTLWQLCQELKQKRQTLIEKLSYTQNYLDEQQSLMSSELLSLRQNNDALSSDLSQLTQHLESLRSNWESRQDVAPQATGGDNELQLLALQFERLAGELTFATLLAQDAAPDQLEQMSALGAEFDPWYRRMHEMRNGGADAGDFITEGRAFAPEFHASLNAARQALVAGFAQAAPAAADEGDAMLAIELETLRAQYQTLQGEYGDLEARLSESQDSSSTQETQLGILTQTVQVIQREFDALRDSNNSLANDLAGLEQQTERIIALAETYRQAALAAVSEAGLQAEAESTPAPDFEVEESEFGVESGDNGDLAEDGASKAEAVREAVRKKLNTLLRHRFGKVPRKVSNGLKDVQSNNKLDKLFDKALKAENIEEFEVALEA